MAWIGVRDMISAYCNHMWWNALKGEIRKTCRTRYSYEPQDTVICLSCGMSQVYHEYMARHVEVGDIIHHEI